MISKLFAHRQSRLVAMLGALLAILLAALDQTIVATALPRIVEEFQGLEHLSWVFSAYMLAQTVTIPLYGKLSDIYGRRVFYLGGIVIFLLGSALSGQSHSMSQLILFRAFQGIGAGAIMVNSIALIGDLFTPVERGRWQGLIGGVFGIASIMGPLLGGWLTDNLTWRWIFYINLPLGILAITVIALALPKIRPEAGDESIDYSGAATMSLGLVSLLLAFVWGGSQYDWGSPQIIGLFSAAVLLFIAFVFIERRVAVPILPLDLFKHRAMSVSVTVTFLTSFGLFGAVAFIPLYAQSVVGFSATNSGLVLTPLMLGLVVSSALAGQLISRTGRYKLSAILGMVLSVVGMYLFTRLSVDTSKTELVRDMIILGAGLGVSFPIYTIVIQSAFERSKLGVVTASIQLFRSVGSTVGIAIMGSLMNNALAQRLADVPSDPFVQSVSRINPDAAITGIDSNSLQSFLSPEGQERMLGMIAGIPQPQQSQLSQAYAGFIDTLKEALAGSIGQVFLLGVFTLALALAVALFLPVIDLRQVEHGPVPEEVGRELEAELVMAEAKDEPEL